MEPKMGKELYVIRKISLSEKPVDVPMNFPRQPQLYLELIENKKKIKPELVNKDYIPPADVSLEPKRPAPSPKWKKPEYKQPSSPADSTKTEFSQETIKTESAKDQLFKKGTPFSEKYLQKPKESTPEVQKPEQTPPPARAPQQRSRLPTLTELENQNKVSRQKELIDIEKLKEEDENAKRELLFKLDILRKTYPKATIDKYTIHDKYSSIKNYYEGRVRLLSLENSVDNYKTYMTFMFMGVETLFGKVFKLDMKGFTEQQLIDYHKYEKLLIEMSESSSGSSQGKSRWPVWVRILFIIVVQTAFFVVGKMILGGAASKILSSVSDMRAAGVSEAESKAMGSGGSSVPKMARKMRGPKINLNEIPDHPAP